MIALLLAAAVQGFGVEQHRDCFSWERDKECAARNAHWNDPCKDRAGKVAPCTVSAAQKPDPYPIKRHGYWQLVERTWRRPTVPKGATLTCEGVTGPPMRFAEAPAGWLCKDAKGYYFPRVVNRGLR